MTCIQDQGVVLLILRWIRRVWTAFQQLNDAKDFHHKASVKVVPSYLEGLTFEYVTVYYTLRHKARDVM